MRIIVIDGINYDVTNDIPFLMSKYSEIINYNIAFDNGKYTVPISINSNIKKKPFYYLAYPYGLALMNEEYLNDSYLSSNIIDFNNIDNIKDYINKIDSIKEINNEYIAKCNTDITEFHINENDDPEFAILKNAINAKFIDIHSYKFRFGNTFSNVLRELKTGNKISMTRLKDIAEALDLEVEIIIRDSKNSLNPMNTSFSKIITKERNEL